MGRDIQVLRFYRVNFLSSQAAQAHSQISVWASRRLSRVVVGNEVTVGDEVAVGVGSEVVFGTAHAASVNTAASLSSPTTLNLRKIHMFILRLSKKPGGEVAGGGAQGYNVCKGCFSRR